MLFAHFSGPPNRLREHARKLVRGMSYAVCLFFGSAQSSSGARPNAFSGDVLCRLLIFRVNPIVFGSEPESFSGEVLCRLLIFRVHPIVFGSEPDSFFGGSPMPFAYFSGPCICRTQAKASSEEVLRRLLTVHPKVFSGEVLCRLLIFRVHPSVFGSEPKSFFRGSLMPFADFSGSYTVWDLNF